MNRAGRSRLVWGSAWALGLVPMMLYGDSAQPDFSQIQKFLGIPSSIARISEANMPPGARVPEIILVQDIHRHPEVQGNIAALLLHGARHWGLKDIYLEGAPANSAVSLPPYDGMKSLRVALQEGLLSGAEMAYAMARPGDLQLEGIENPDVYKQNVEAYQAAQNQQSQALQLIETARMLEETLDLSQRRLSSEQLDRLELLARLKLKPFEYARYLEERESMQLSPDLQQALEPAERFYELANRRSDIFLEQSRLHPSSDPMVFVVGGFHTARMAEELKKQGRSFVVFSPRVTQSGFDDLYARGMQDTISALKLH